MASKDREDHALVAQQSFEKGDYISTLQHLKKLETRVGTINKHVRHNKSLAEFMQSNMCEVTKFTNSICELVGINFPEVEEVELSDPYFIYNYAVLLYHSRHYYQSTCVLDKLLTTTKVIKNKKLLQQIVLLLMEGSLCQRTANKALEILKSHGEVVNGNSELSMLLDRLVSRANLMSGLKIKPTLKPDSIENLFIIAQQQYVNKDYNGANNTLAQYKNIKINYDLKSQGEDVWAAFNNNLGAIFLAMKKPFIATKYFQHSVKEHFKSIETNDGKRLITYRDCTLYVYNLGLSLYAANKPEAAFECLVEAVRHYPNNARLWLRLAECCVKKCCNEEIRANNNDPKSPTTGPNEKSTDESFAIPTLSFEFAVLCLRNAAILLQRQEVPKDVDAPIFQLPPGKPISWKQRCYLMNAILLLRTKVLLKVQNASAALAAANELLNQPEIGYGHKVLGHLYAAEALIKLDKLVEVTDHITPQLIHDLPSSFRDTITTSIWTKSATAYILKRDYLTARKIVSQISTMHVLPLLAYLEVCIDNMGNSHTVVNKIRNSKSPRKMAGGQS